MACVLWGTPPRTEPLDYLRSREVLHSVQPVHGPAGVAGGLAWLAVLGEDAPDLVGSAPIPARAIIWAKIEAILGSVFVIAAPLLIALAVAAPVFATIAALGVVAAASSGTMIQFWYRDGARRVGLRRRQIPSRVATLAEALSSILRRWRTPT